MLLYTAVAEDGTGPWLYGLNVERRIPHRISFGVERYTSISTRGDRQRLVVTVANPHASLWRVPISDHVVQESEASRVAVPATRALAPRIGPGYLLYLSSKGGNDGILKFADGTAVELWSGSLGRVLEGAAISPDGRRIAFTAQKGGRNRLYLMNADGTSVTELAGSLDIRPRPSVLNAHLCCRALNSGAASSGRSTSKFGMGWPSRPNTLAQADQPPAPCVTFRTRSLAPFLS